MSARRRTCILRTACGKVAWTSFCATLMRCPRQPPSKRWVAIALLHPYVSSGVSSAAEHQVSARTVAF
eukprot:2820876-Amphidinium_carterae.1